MRTKLGAIITNRPQFPDVVGDRKLLRFLKGHGNDVDKAVEMAVKFLKWRDTCFFIEVNTSSLNTPLINCQSINSVTDWPGLNTNFLIPILYL